MAETIKLEGPEAKRRYMEDAANSGVRPQDASMGWLGVRYGPRSPETEVGFFPRGQQTAMPAAPPAEQAPGPRLPMIGDMTRNDAGQRAREQAREAVAFLTQLHGKRSNAANAAPKAPARVPTYPEIAQSEDFKALPAQEQRKFRQRYFDDKLARTPDWRSLSAEDQQKVYTAFMGGDLRREQPKDFEITTDPFKIAQERAAETVGIPMGTPTERRAPGIFDVLGPTMLTSGMHAPTTLRAAGKGAGTLWQRFKNLLPPYQFGAGYADDAAKLKMEQLLKGGGAPTAGAATKSSGVKPGLPRNMQEMQEYLRAQDKAAFDKAMREAIDALQQAQNVAKKPKKVKPTPATKPAAEYIP